MSLHPQLNKGRWIYFDMKQKLFKMTPKLHLFIHLCEQAVLLGKPRFYWTYADEDLVGQFIEIAETVHPTTMAITALFKWLHLLFDGDSNDGAAV